MKCYFLTDESGAPLKIESLWICHEEILHAWTYSNVNDLLKVFNEKAEVLNQGHKKLHLWKLIGFSILLSLAFIGLEDVFRIFVH